jgi:di/tricarboxylate transporter
VTPALASLLALIAAIAVSMTSRVNVGLLAIALAWLIGVYVAGLSPEVVQSGFPVSLFMTLAGVTLLFAIAETNGTLERLAHRATALARGNARVIPWLFFVMAMALSSVGPGAISTVALMIPLAVAIGQRVGVPHLLTALMVANGANAGNLSPVSSVGVIANSRMAESGLAGHEGKVWFANFVAHALVGVLAYLLFGRRHDGRGGQPPVIAATPPIARNHAITAAAILLWVVGVVVFKISLGLSAFALAVLLLIARQGDESAALRQVPWGIIMMVSGVAVLIALLEKTGGMDLFTALLAKLASPASVYGVIAFITGAISTYSSTSGVVLPAFLPTVPSLVAQVGGGDPLAVALSINIGSAVVDVSPLSTLGALCVAAVGDAVASRRLFRQLLAWGLSMTVVGALIAQLIAGPIARW